MHSLIQTPQPCGVASAYACAEPQNPSNHQTIAAVRSVANPCYGNSMYATVCVGAKSGKLSTEGTSQW